jgi:hypothetical protein
MDHQRPSYASRLLTQLTTAELQQIAVCMRRQLLDHIVPWQTRLVYITAAASPLPRQGDFDVCSLSPLSLGEG